VADAPDQEHLNAWLRLSLTQHLSRADARALLQRFGLPGEVVAAGRSALAQVVGAAAACALTKDDPAREALIAQSLEWARQPEHHLIALDDPRFPSPLLQAPDPPLLLYLVGDPTRLARPMIAIVGSRSATPTGEETAEQFGRALGAAGLTVVSGLALGIDAAAHRGALDSDAGTVAVMGTGADRIQPARNRGMAHQIARNGALISELPLGSPGLPAHFPARNRIIAGLSRGTLVVEAAIRSGSLITARLASDIGREVFAIPGSIHSPVARGCHKLIRDGAKLVESVDDILVELGLQKPPPEAVRVGRSGSVPPAEKTTRGNALSDSDHLLLGHLDHAPINPDRLLARAGIEPSVGAAGITRLELAGKLERLADGRVRRRSD
jgi:DNA processing protein